MAAKLIRWLVFTIFFSLLPILASYLESAATTAAGWPEMSSVLAHGELYLLASSFSAAGLGRSHRRERKMAYTENNSRRNVSSSTRSFDDYVCVPQRSKRSARKQCPT
jgi:hypothetical protein